MYFKINNIDFSHMVSGLKVGYETIVSDTASGRTADGKMTIKPIATKVKLYITFRYSTVAEMRSLLGAIEGYSNLRISYLNPRTNTLDTITAYTGTPEPEYYSISDKTIYKPMSLNFIEL